MEKPFDFTVVDEILKSILLMSGPRSRSCRIYRNTIIIFRKRSFLVWPGPSASEKPDFMGSQRSMRTFHWSRKENM